MDLIKSGRYIDIFYAKTCATTKISTAAGYHVVLATVLFYSLCQHKSFDRVNQNCMAARKSYRHAENEPKTVTYLWRSHSLNYLILTRNIH